MQLPHRWSGALLALVIVLLLIGIGSSLHLATVAGPLMEQAEQFPPGKERVAAQREVLQYQTDNQLKIWTAIVQAGGAVVLAIGGYFAWRNVQVAQDNLKTTQEAQITNRFTQAIGQLGAELKDGSPNLEVRLGGIYALERIARDSPRDHWTIMEVLTAYLRQNAPWCPPPAPLAFTVPGLPRAESQQAQEPPRPRVDIQAILTVLGRRTPSEKYPEPSSLDLSGTDLRGTNLTRVRLEGANLYAAHLERADLAGAHLEGAVPFEAHLERADLAGAHLEGAVLFEAHLEGATLVEAHLEGATLVEAHLEGADLTRAHLKGANLFEAHLEGATLVEAHLEGATLFQAKGLTRDQLKDAHGVDTAVLPDYLKAPGTAAANA